MKDGYLTRYKLVDKDMLPLLTVQPFSIYLIRTVLIEELWINIDVHSQTIRLKCFLPSTTNMKYLFGQKYNTYVSNS